MRQGLLRPGAAIPGERALSAEAFELSLSPGAPVCRLRRLRTADDVRMALETSIVSMRFLPDSAMVDGSLYAALKKRSTVPVRALQRMRATVADRAQAEQLGIEPGAPLLDMERRCFNQAGEAVEFLFGLMLTTERAVPITVGTSFFFSASGGGIRWGVASAVMVVSVLPPLLIGLIAYRFIGRAVTAGAVKG